MANRRVENRPVDRRRGVNWIWILLILLLVVVLLWWLWPEAAVDEPVGVEVEEMDPVETPALQGEPVMPAAPGEAILVVRIVDDPVTWSGRTVQGNAQVESVPTDRGFWIQAEGERLFVVLDEQGDEVPVHVQSGETIRIAAAEVHGAEDLEEVSGNLDDQTRQILQDQEVFLTTDDADVTMEPGTGGMEGGMEGGTGEAGTGPGAGGGS